jgi:hypothetical protein
MIPRIGGEEHHFELFARRCDAAAEVPVAPAQHADGGRRLAALSACRALDVE